MPGTEKFQKIKKRDLHQYNKYSLYMSLKYTFKKKIKFSKNKYRKSKKGKNTKNKSRKSRKSKIKGGSFGGPSYGPSLHQMPLDMSAIVYINQMIGMGYDPQPLVEDFVQQMYNVGHMPQMSRMVYQHQLIRLGYYPMIPQMTPHMGPMMGYPMGSMMGHPMAAMTPQMVPGMAAMSPQFSPQMSPENIPPPAVLQRQPSDSVMLYEQLKTNDARKTFMNDIMVTIMKDYTFGDDKINDKITLMPGTDGFINKKKSGYYFNWNGPNKDGKMVKKCHLTLHATPSIDEVGTLHVKDDEKKNLDGKAQSIKISINHRPPRDYNISIEDNTNPPNPRLNAFAKKIVEVFIRYYNTCGETATFV